MQRTSVGELTFRSCCISWLRLWLMQVAEIFRTGAMAERDSHRGLKTNTYRLIRSPHLDRSS